MKLGRLWILAVLAPLACSLTSSLDDLGANAGQDAGTDQSASGGGSGGSGGGSGGKSGGSGGGVGGFPTGGSGGSGGSSGSGGGGFPDASDPCVSQADCNACCGSSHAEGQQLFVAAIKKCVCQDPACSTPCSTYCGGGALSAACSTCVSSQAVQDCIAKECGAGQCKVYTDCIAGC